MLDFKRLTVLGAALVASSLVAQESVGTIVGSVKDANGAPVAGATLTIAGAKILGQRVITSNDRGEFRIPLLPPGEYSLSVRKDGMVGSKAEIRLGAGSTLRQDFTMRVVQTAQAEVEVVATAATVDKTETKTSTNLTLDTLQNLPLGLNSYAALAMSPGVVAPAGSGYPVIRGGLTGQSQFTVNGISVRDNVVRQGRQFEVVMDDMTEDVSVIQSPLNAKYGFASGGIVNLVTKSGTNEFQGTLRAKLYRADWGAVRRPILNRYKQGYALNPGSVQSDDLDRTYEVSILGPLIKDHLTFAYAARLSPTVFSNTQLTNLHDFGLTGLPGGATAWTYGATPDQAVQVGGPQKTMTQQYKLYWLVNQNHQVEVFFTDDELGPYFDTQSGNVDGFAAFNQTSKRTFAGVNYRGVIGANGVLDVRAGRRKSEVNFSSGPFDPITVRAWYPGTPSLIDTTGWSGGTVLTNGDTARPVAELRQVETASINYNWFNGTHNADFGMEMLKETAFLPDQSGPNRQRFFSPGRRDDGLYAVWNYTLIPTPSATVRNSTAYIPEVQTYADSVVSDDQKNYDTTFAVYANDLWTINSNWSVMAGVRFEKYKVEDLSGTRLTTNSLSPRVEVKYDLMGNNMHLLSASYAQFRGTIGQGNLGGFFSRRPGQRISRYWWNQGTGTPTAPQYVPQSDVLNTANYGYLYAVDDSYYLYDIDKNLKPDVTHEMTMSYRRSFANGGFFRGTLVYRNFKDLWYREGLNTAVDVPGSPTVTPEGYLSILTFDPHGKREYKGVEFEWSYPLYRAANQRLDFQGNWTINRTYATNTWREGNVASSAAEFYDLKDALGISRDLYNPYGELNTSVHNVVKGWLSWSVGAPNGLRQVVSLLGRYSSGAPYSLTGTRAFDTASATFQNYFDWDAGTAGAQYALTTPSTYTTYYNGRGKFTNFDSFTFDLQWNVFIPIKGRVQFFSYLSINNVFNSPQPTGFGSAYGGGALTAANPNYTYIGTQFQNFGVVSGMGNYRGVNIDLGIKF